MKKYKIHTTTECLQTAFYIILRTLTLKYNPRNFNCEHLSDTYCKRESLYLKLSQS